MPIKCSDIIIVLYIYILCKWYNAYFLTFRSLRTLLLEGNKLTTLPPQLGRLRHLTGLNLSNNPLESPPKSIIEKGTKVSNVLNHRFCPSVNNTMPKSRIIYGHDECL